MNNTLLQEIYFEFHMMIFNNHWHDKVYNSNMKKKIFSVYRLAGLKLPSLKVVF